MVKIVGYVEVEVVVVVKVFLGGGKIEVGILFF